MILDIWMESLSSQSTSTSKSVTQNAFHCRFDCDTTVNNVFTFGPDGKVFFCALNYPGSWADSSLTARFLPHIKKRIVTMMSLIQAAITLLLTGMFCSAFPQCC